MVHSSIGSVQRVHVLAERIHLYAAAGFIAAPQLQLHLRTVQTDCGQPGGDEGVYIKSKLVRLLTLSFLADSEGDLVLLLLEAGRIYGHNFLHNSEEGPAAHFLARLSPQQHVCTVVDRSEVGAKWVILPASPRKLPRPCRDVSVLRAVRAEPASTLSPVEEVFDDAAAGAVRNRTGAGHECHSDRMRLSLVDALRALYLHDILPRPLRQVLHPDVRG